MTSALEQGLPAGLGCGGGANPLIEAAGWNGMTLTIKDFPGLIHLVYSLKSD